jgi:hypothetical protein
MAGLSTRGHNVAEQPLCVAHVAVAEVAESSLIFHNHLRAGVAAGACGCPAEEALARVEEAGLTAILKELARGDGGLPWGMQDVGNEAIRKWMTQADRANMAMYVHHAMSRIMRGRFANTMDSLIRQNARFAALALRLNNMKAIARAIMALQKELDIIATAAASWACAADASALALERAQRIRRAWCAFAGAIRFRFETMHSACHQVASAYTSHRNLSGRLAHMIALQQ